MKYDVVGIGNPLMDIMIKVDDKEIERMGLVKGSMKLVNDAELAEYEEMLGDRDMKLVPGGSVANTLTGIASLGGVVQFIGKVGRDNQGKLYEKKLIEGKVHAHLVQSDGTTGRVISLVTPDSERTFITYLGCALDLKKDEISEIDGKVLHLTGYQLEPPVLRETSFRAIEIAKQKNMLVSVDLADPKLVSRNLSLIKDAVKNADIVFANEEEAQALVGKNAIDKIQADTIVIKLGGKGSIIRHNGNITKVGPSGITPIDTTGAGDMYAAGILYGVTHGLDMKKSSKIAAHMAGEIIKIMGARFENPDFKFLLSD